VLGQERVERLFILMLEGGNSLGGHAAMALDASIDHNFTTMADQCDGRGARQEDMVAVGHVAINAQGGTVALNFRYANDAATALEFGLWMVRSTDEFLTGRQRILEVTGAGMALDASRLFVGLQLVFVSGHSVRIMTDYAGDSVTVVFEVAGPEIIHGRDDFTTLNRSDDRSGV